MTVAVNVRHLIPNKMEGIGLFSYQIMKRITQKHSDVNFYFLFDRNFSDRFLFSENITPIILSPPARHPLLIYYWNEYLVPDLLNKLKPDVYVSLDGFISKRATYKQYAVVHDVNFAVYPQYLTWSLRKLYEYFFIKHSCYATRIATVSEFSKTEIVKYLNYPLEKIDVVYNASNLHLESLNDEQAMVLKQRYTQGKNYFLFIGSINPRKNVEGLLKAFELYKAYTGSDDKLIIVGRSFWGNSAIQKLYRSSRYKNDIVFTGRLEDTITACLLHDAKALVYVSHYEGFGVPVVEAMQIGTPVITSSTTALSEVAGEAAIKIHPQDMEGIAMAMKKISEDQGYVQLLIEKGKIQAQKFNWDKSADQFWEGIVKVMEEV